MWHGINVQCRQSVQHHLRNVLRPRKTTIENDRRRLLAEKEVLSIERTKFKLLMFNNSQLVNKIKKSHDAVETNRFKGIMRTRHYDYLTGIQTTVRPQMTKHQENLKLLEARIKTIDNTRTVMLNELNHINNQIADLEARLTRSPLIEQGSW
jgi:predicted  nucleic acid-binding Zn-ribbon protein